MIDLRSDTLTKPGNAMRHAMARAEVGDDVYAEDPTVSRLEETVAAMFGRPGALFFPSGSMANQTALQVLVAPGDEVLTDADAHIVSYELGAAARYGGIQTRTVVADRGLLDPGVVAAQIRLPRYGTVPTRAVAIENTHNRGGGAVYPFETLQRLRAVTEAAGVQLHCDGARIWHAAIAQDRPLPDYAALADTLMVSVSKALGAPVGSLLIGTPEVLGQARVIRKRLGGGMRQSGVIAAAALVAVTGNVARLADDHRRARELATACADARPGVCDPAQVETNIVLLNTRELQATPSAPWFVERAGDAGLRAGVLGPDTVRLVTHLDVTDADIAAAVKILRDLLKATD
ncbi:MAG: GntG family PLP-dependent aldolase [Actinomycetota bacterium]